MRSFNLLKNGTIPKYLYPTVKFTCFAGFNFALQRSSYCPPVGARFCPRGHAHFFWALTDWKQNRELPTSPILAQLVKSKPGALAKPLGK